MSQVLKRRWQTTLGGSGLPRRDTRPCDYEAYVPDPLVGRMITLDGSVAADVVDAETAIVRLNTEATALVDTEALARILLRAEARDQKVGGSNPPERAGRKDKSRWEEPGQGTMAPPIAPRAPGR